VPFIARWPETIPAGKESAEAITVMDLLPTLTKLASGDVPSDRVIDGKDIWPLLAGKPDAKSPHDGIFYLRGRSVNGVRSGDWKYLADRGKDKGESAEVELSEAEKKLPRGQRKALVKERQRDAPKDTGDIEMLFNLRDDIAETRNLITQHPEIAERLKEQARKFEAELKKNQRPAGAAK
jgi:arylsulfatase A-like enzyme